MPKLLVHDIRTRQLSPTDNGHLKIGRPSVKDYVTSFSIQNTGRNSLLKIIKDGNEIHLRPYEPPLSIEVDFPSILDCSLQMIFETENQQQYPSDGSARPAVDTSPADVTAADALYHRATLAEVFYRETINCET